MLDGFQRKRIMYLLLIVMFEKFNSNGKGRFLLPLLIFGFRTNLLLYCDREFRNTAL